MHYATSSQDVTAVKSILEKTPLAAYIKDEQGSSPLHVAARMCNYDVIDSIIKCCPDSFELRDNRGCNFLHILAEHGGGKIDLNPNVKQNLISILKFVSRSPELKTLVNERDSVGNTPLHLAARSGCSEVILQLIKSEADTKLMNNEGKTALDHALSLSSFFLMVRSNIYHLVYDAIYIVWIL
jgi:ankyrin repeat protein